MGKQERHRDARERILEAVWQLAADKGLTGWTMREVGAAVGMRAASLYVYFASKQDIYDALFAQGYTTWATTLTETIADADAAGEDPLTRLKRGVRVYIQFAQAQPARFQMVFLRTVPGFEPSPESMELAFQALQPLDRVLVDVGLASPEAADLLTALLTGMASQQLSNDPGGDRWLALTDLAVDVFITGLVASNPAPG